MKIPVSHPGSKRSIAIGLVTFTALMLLTQGLVYQRYLINRKAKEERTLHELNSIKDRLNIFLNCEIAASKTLAFIIEEYGLPKNFNTVAKNILESNDLVDGLGLTKEGVITNVYPLKGNESVIGFDILKDSMQNKEAYLAIKRREVFFAGPLNLKQGGVGIVGRLPIFIDTTFLGFATVIIKLPTLLKAAGIDKDHNNGFVYQLSKLNPITQKEEFFLPDYIPSDKKEFASIDVPDGAWRLYVRVENDKHILFIWIAFSILGVIISILGGLFSWNQAQQPGKLKRLVDEKTKELAGAEKYFHALIDKSSDAIVLIDVSGKVLYQSEAAERLSGYSLLEMQNLNSSELVHPDDREADNELFTKWIQLPGTSLKLRHRIKHKNGNYIWIEGSYTNLLENENVKAIVYNYQDITSRIEAEEAVMDSERKYRDLFDNNPMPMWVMDKYTYCYLDVNNAALEHYGYSRQEFLSMTMFDLRPADEIERLKEFIIVNKDDTYHPGIWRHLKKDHTVIDVEIIFHDIKFNQQQAVLVLANDVTEKLKTAAEIESSNSQLKELTSHLEFVREEERTLLARALHDEIGQQLTGLKMDASWISRKIANDDLLVQEKLRDMIHLIDESVKSIRGISTYLRPGILDDLGLIPALEWQTMEFEKRFGIKSLFHTHVIEFNHGKELSTNIFRVCQEALTNVARHANATFVEVTFEQKDDIAKLIIKDNGIGFDIMEAKNKKSWGLIGMKERAMLFHGKLTIESEKQKGTSIILTVPIHVKDKTKS